MKLSELIEKIEILEMNADPETEISEVCYDSRNAVQGCLFIAISGFTTDGNRYVSSAVEKGAVAVISEKKPDTDIPYIIVDNCRRALALVSCAYFGYPADSMNIIGITGTSGKTTCSYLIKHMLEECLDAKVGLVGTNGNMIGDTFLHADRTTPESFELQKLFREMADSGCSWVVMEVSSHSLVLDRVAGIRFKTAVYTNLSRDHLDFHKDMDDYARAKSILFSRCDSACINLDDDYSEVMLKAAGCPVITSSALDDNADLIAKDIRYSAEGVRFAAVYNDEIAMTMLPIPGMFSVYNALSVISAGISAGIDFKAASGSLKTASRVKGRMEKVPVDASFSVVLDYSHKPDALEKVLNTLRPVTKGRLICVFGCGGDRDREKRPIMGRIGTELADICIITSDNPRHEEPMDIINEILAGVKNNDKKNLKVICDRIEAIHWALDNAAEGDVILLAGKGHEDYQEIGDTKIHMDEYEIVTKYMQGKSDS